MENGKVYSKKAIGVATYLGGPLIGGYLISENFKLFKNEDLARKMLFGSLFFFVFFFELLFLIPEQIVDKIPNFIFPALYSGLAYLIINHWQEELIEKFIESGGLKQSGWKITGISVIGFVITMAYIFLRVSFISPFPGEVMEFGSLKHQIYYDENINTKDVETIGEALIDFGYFQSPEQQAVNLVLSESEYHLYIYVQKDWWENQDLLESLQQFENSINQKALENQLQIIMYEETLKGKITKVLPKK